MDFHYYFYNFVGYFAHFQTIYYSNFWHHIIGRFIVNSYYGYFSASFWYPWLGAGLYIVGRLFLFFFFFFFCFFYLQHPFCFPPETVSGKQANNIFIVVSLRLGFSTIYYYEKQNQGKFGMENFCPLFFCNHLHALVITICAFILIGKK